MTRDELEVGIAKAIEAMEIRAHSGTWSPSPGDYVAAALSAIEESGLVIVNRKSLESVYEAAKLSEPIIDALIKEMSPNG